MPSLRLSEIEDLLKEEDELTEIELRRKKRKERKTNPYGYKYTKKNTYDNGDDEVID